MDGLFSWLSGSPDIAQIIAAVAMIVLAVVLMRVFSPVGEGVGHAVSKVGDAVDDVASGVVAPLRAVEAFAGGVATAMVQDAKNREEVFSFVVNAGDGRTLSVQGHGYGTAPKLADRLSNIPSLPAPPRVAGLLGSGRK